MDEQIELTEHARWAPIPLGVDPEEIRTQLAGAFAGAASYDADAGAAAMAGVAAQLQAPPSDGSVNLAAWARVATPNELDVLGFATLRVVPLEPDASHDDVMALLLAGQQLFQDPAVTTISTRSGDAVSVQLRPLVDGPDGQVEVHQVSAVLWSRPTHRALFMLSAYDLDLVEATETAELLDELAAGIAGMSA
jgi:hypothetical protein